METKKLLLICGPTATGKTKLALHLAKKCNGELVSADSRQVYKHLDIGTGKDIPGNFEFRKSNLKIGHYTNGKIRLWGYDLVNPTEEFSVGQYITIARTIIKDIWKRGKLPILIGGTGLYIKGVVEGVPSASVPKNKKLRKKLDKKTTKELLEILTRLDFNKAKFLNDSDRKNPRRLVRAIEIAKFPKRIISDIVSQPLDKHTDILKIGLKIAKESLNKKIDKRVDRRVKQGIHKEIKALLASGVSWEDQAMQSLGYRQWKKFWKKLEDKHEAISKWKQAEKQYAKRQITWFKKDKDINWFDAGETKLVSIVEKFVQKWHNGEV